MYRHKLAWELSAPILSCRCIGQHIGINCPKFRLMLSLGHLQAKAAPQSLHKLQGMAIPSPHAVVPQLRAVSVAPHSITKHHAKPVCGKMVGSITQHRRSKNEIGLHSLQLIQYLRLFTGVSNFLLQFSILQEKAMKIFCLETNGLGRTVGELHSFSDNPFPVLPPFSQGICSISQDNHISFPTTHN